MPTIYWDESSRGYHGNQGRTPYTRGRWVGEKMLNGKRIRMRSTDYDKVVAWVNSEKPKPEGIKLKGYPNYYVNVERREIYGRGGKPIRSTKVNAREMYGLTKDGKRFFTQWNRIAYAAINGIDVRKIPQDLSVEYRNGQYVLEYLGDVLSHLWEQRRNDNFAKIENSSVRFATVGRKPQAVIIGNSKNNKHDRQSRLLEEKSAVPLGYSGGTASLCRQAERVRRATDAIHRGRYQQQRFTQQLL